MGQSLQRNVAAFLGSEFTLRREQGRLKKESAVRYLSAHTLLPPAPGLALIYSALGRARKRGHSSSTGASYLPDLPRCPWMACMTIASTSDLPGDTARAATLTSSRPSRTHRRHWPAWPATVPCPYLGRSPTLGAGRSDVALRRFPGYEPQIGHGLAGPPSTLRLILLLTQHDDRAQPWPAAWASLRPRPGHRAWRAPHAAWERPRATSHAAVYRQLSRR